MKLESCKLIGRMVGVLHQHQPASLPENATIQPLSRTGAGCGAVDPLNNNLNGAVSVIHANVNSFDSSTHIWPPKRDGRMKLGRKTASIDQEQQWWV